MQLHIINNYTYISQVCLLGLGIFITVIGMDWGEIDGSVREKINWLRAKLYVKFVNFGG